MTKVKDRLSSKEKNSNKGAWYIEWADILDGKYYDSVINYNGVPESVKMQVNYDLFNDKLNLADFEYVCKPFGSEVGELPASMVNRDIVSGKIKSLMGMEMKRPFSWTVVATNPEATTRKEQQEFGMLKDFVISQIMTPIRQKIEIEKAQQAQGQDLTPEQQQAISTEIEQELQAKTPEEVKKYMLREHQDPAEIMSVQLLNYLIKKCDINKKFNDTFKHGLISALELMYVGVLNGEPQVWTVNSKRFNCDKTGDIEFIEDKEWATCRYKMTPSEIIKHFSKELTDEDIDLIYSCWSGGKTYYHNPEDLFAMMDKQQYDKNSDIEVIHCVWKALRKIGFLSYLDENGVIQELLVDENYKINKDAGDVKVEWEWIPEVYETWKIKTSEPIYVNKRPLPGQFKDLDNLYHCKLPYYGILYDNMNSEPTSLMDRIKPYQYYYNIIMYKLELLIASDKGKKILMNIGSIPTSSGIDIEKWQYFFESSPFAWVDFSEEGNTYADINAIAKEIDLSLVSDIQKYIEVAEYLRRQCGVSVGITDQVEGQIGPNDAVNNTRQNLIQSSHILEMYFELHNYVKRNVLQALLETAKIAYADTKPMKLSYVLDDMSDIYFDFDITLLENSTLGLFVENSVEAAEAIETLKTLAHAAVQNQKIELSDVVSIIRQKSVVEIGESLLVAEERRREYEQMAQDKQLQAQAEEAEKAREFIREQHEMNKEIVVLKETERRETVIAQAALTGLSFNPETDIDKDGVPDFLEIAKAGLNAKIATDKQALDERKQKHKEKIDEEKIKNDKEKIAIQKAKNQQKSVKT